MNVKNSWDYNLFRTQYQLLCFQKKYIVCQKEHLHLKNKKKEENEER